MTITQKSRRALGRFLSIAGAAVLLTQSSAMAQTPSAELNRLAQYERQAQNVTIIRDDWGIPHVYGKTDADAVFGVVYAQAEDDFNRVETNFINAMGRLAEAEGESAIYRDLRMKLFIDPDTLKSLYAQSPEWLKKLMNAWADGLNYYLAKNPQVKPRVIKHFEPWMALSFSEGSIGGDIERVDVRQLEAFYGGRPAPTIIGQAPQFYQEPTGSNGVAIAPSNTKNGKALLLINPHTSFFFRAEAQMVSEEGLNAYGAITWGQFFIYQGFNEKAGWMHTSSSVDNIDEYLETIVQKGDRLYYRYGSEERPVATKRITVPYRTANGSMAEKVITAYFTHHGPIVRQEDGKWISVRLMNTPLAALTQSYTRTKAKNYREFRQTMDLHTNSSNNTIFADAEGNIAYFHANFIPKRDPRFDWTKPVDGSNPATEWGPVLSIDESPLVVNPATGWLFNTNNSPWSAAGPNSPKPSDYAPYVDAGSENARGLHAIMVLKDRKDFTIESLRAAAYDSYLPYFTDLVPQLVRAWEQAPASSPLKAKLAEQIAMLRSWDLRWSVSSIPTSLAVYFGEELDRRAQDIRRVNGIPVARADDARAAAIMLESLAAASDKLTADFGTWKTPWGEINRFQRLTGDIVHPFTDAGPSIPVGFTSARWGSLASFGARSYNGSKRIYGTSGNSFVAIVEFGKDGVRAKAITAGGQNGSPQSKHFNDQAQRYSTGDLREVYFYRSELEGHTGRQYQPGR